MYKLRELYPGAEEHPSGCVADFDAARPGHETATDSSVTGAELELTVASLLACSVCKK